MTFDSSLFTPPIQQAIAITPGDPCGIGPEIIARAWCLSPEVTQGCFVAGDVGLMRRAMALVQTPQNFPVLEINNAKEALAEQRSEQHQEGKAVQRRGDG